MSAESGKKPPHPAEDSQKPYSGVFDGIAGRRVLVSPLDWGLGHAARIAGVIRFLMLRNKVCVMCGPSALGFLAREIPEAEIILINDWRIRYPRGRISLLTILGWIPVVVRNSVHEHFYARRVIRERSIDFVLSDNRYGLCFKGLECMIATHQVYPKMPGMLSFLESACGWLFKKYLSIFSKVLIPDFQRGESLSGLLAGGRNLDPAKFVRIGILSRFSGAGLQQASCCRYDILALVSGQECQRTVFENMLVDALGGCGKRVLLVRGVGEGRKPPEKIPGCIECRNMLSGKALERALVESAVVVCRAGYSTLCDVVALGKRAVIVATPGQTEQEYLAGRLDGKFGFRSLSQDSPRFGARLLELVGECGENVPHRE